MAVGRKPNTDDIGLERAGVQVDDAGLIPTDEECRSNVAHIFAIGDVAPGPMLAHKASREDKVAAEVIADHYAAFDNFVFALSAFRFQEDDVTATSRVVKNVPGCLATPPTPSTTICSPRAVEMGSRAGA